MTTLPTLFGAVNGRLSIGCIVGNSGINAMDFGGRRWRHVDTDVAVDVDGRGSSITTLGINFYRRLFSDHLYFSSGATRRRHSTPVPMQLYSSKRQ